MTKLAFLISGILLRRILKLYNLEDECTKTISRATIPASKAWQLWRLGEFVARLKRQRYRTWARLTLPR